MSNVTNPSDKKKKEIIGVIPAQNFAYDQLEALQSELSMLMPDEIIWASMNLEGELEGSLNDAFTKEGIKNVTNFVRRGKCILLALHALLRPEY